MNSTVGQGIAYAAAIIVLFSAYRDSLPKIRWRSSPHGFHYTKHVPTQWAYPAWKTQQLQGI